MAKLTNDEKKLSRSYDKGDWKPVKHRKGEIKRYQSYVREALQKSSRVNIRISPQDLEGMQQKALEEGIPYQTLMASVIHKYVAGSLVERHA